jgi:hypothetical protein
MLRKVFWAVAVMVCSIVPVAVHAQGDYLDVYMVKAKPEKAVDLESIAKKMVDANRRYNGDHWLAMETVYGEGDTIAFVSNRKDYADVDNATGAFMGALEKAYGKDGAEKMLNEWNNCLAGSRSELRKRRWDLSWKAPQPGSYAKFIGESRVLRTTAVHVRPGHGPDFEALLKDIKTAEEENPNTQPVLVSQVVEGGKGTIFYLTGLRTGMGGFDKNPTLHEILGEDGYKKFLQISADSIESTESTLLRFSPEMSNPPNDILAAAADFWQPKPAVAATKTKSKPPVEAAAKKPKQ